MTMEKREVDSALSKPQHKVLIIKNDLVVAAQNHEDRGPAIPIIASLLMPGAVNGQYLGQFYVGGVHLYNTLAQLNNMMQDHIPGWLMRFTNRRRHAFTARNQVHITGRFYVDYISVDQHVSATDKTVRLPRRKCEIINLELFRDRPPELPNEQLEMALCLLDLCDHRGISFRGTRGGIGSALLRASDAWTRKRRPAPRFINEKARIHLPGNFYSISNSVRCRSPIDPMEHCFYIDQRSAHHTIASQIDLPHPEDVKARGFYKRDRGRWCSPKDPIGQRILDGTLKGLVLCKILTAVVGPNQAHLYPPWAHKRGNKFVWLWTPELRLFAKDHRLDLDYFVGGFFATESDPVLREYAEWSLDEIATDQQRAFYKKSCLLAAYGMLAYNSEIQGRQRFIYRYWGGSRKKDRDRVEIPEAGYVIESKIQFPKNVQMSVVNVLARGLIESETRTRSLEYAKELNERKLHVAQIYVDGLLVETHQLPFVQPNWRVAYSLHHVFVPRPNAIISDEIVKLPGIGGDEQDREWLRNREEARKVIRAKKVVEL